MTDPSDLAALMPFARTIGVQITAAAPDQVTGHLDWTDDVTTAGGLMHGGALMSLADSIGAVCAFLNLPPDATTSTTSSSTVFVRGVSAGRVTAVAAPVHVGRRTIVVRTDLSDGEGRLVAQVTQTQAVLAG